ncbi:MAG: sensor histidine kinase [Chitinophagales bacterium]
MTGNRLERRIIGLLVTVALVATLTTAIAGIYAARQLFSNYLNRTASVKAEDWAITFSAYYAENGSFSGITSFLDSRGNGRGFGKRRGIGNRVILLGLSDTVEYDSAGLLYGKRISASESADGVPVTVNGNKVGTVLMPGVGMRSLNSLESNFINSFTNYSLLAGLIAALIALALGILILRTIARPIHALSDATRRLARGEKDVRVPLKGDGELRELAEDFNTMAESLRKMETMRRNLSADLAHELRTPLTVLRANLESWQSGATQPTFENITSLHDEVIRISKLVKDMENLSLAETGNLPLNVRQATINELFDMLTPVMLEAEARSLKVDIQLDESLPSIRVDLDRTLQVMLNLLSNAMAHSPAEGRIIIKGEKKGEMVQISVSDQGMGIPTEQLPFIFERFYRADNARSRQTGGMGLGLAIARGYIEAQGGRIWAESTPGRGSVFYFTLPQEES